MLISQRGWKTREPVETEFPAERPGLFPRILNLHSNELGYGVPEFSKLLGTPWSCSDRARSWTSMIVGVQEPAGEQAFPATCRNVRGWWKTSTDKVVVGGERIELPTNGV